MPLRAQLSDDLNRTMREASSEEGKQRLAVLRLLLAAVKNEEIAISVREQGLNDEQMIAVIRREVKRRRDAALVYRGHHEEDRAKGEEREADILQAYLPAAPDTDTVMKVVTGAIDKLPEAQRNMGNVMKAVMAEMKGAVDGQTVRKLVEDALSKNAKS